MHSLVQVTSSIRLRAIQLRAIHLIAIELRAIQLNSLDTDLVSEYRGLFVNRAFASSIQV